MINDIERQRLAAILGMLGSEHAGERAAAALQAEAFRKKHGLTWAELLALRPEDLHSESSQPPPPEPEPPPAPRDYNIFPVALAIWGAVTACLASVFFG